MPLLTLTGVRVAFGHLPLLEEAGLQVEAGERIAVLGRNGTGKSTLLQVLDGTLPPDAGSVWRQPGLRMRRLVQDVPLVSPRPVFDTVADGLGDLGTLVADYHHAALEVATHGTEAALARLGTLQHALDERDGWTLERRVELVVSRLALPAEAIVDALSGGWRRRVLLAQALVSQPDVLLLDEPTNHLDIDAIAWLEEFLVSYAGAVVFVTHDRAFLERVATRIVDLDRGRLTSWPVAYATYLQRKDEAQAAEQTAQARFDKRLATEEAWLRQGIKARRTRDEGRVRALLAMRAARAARRAQMGQVRLAVRESDPSGQVVFEAEHLHKAYGDQVVIRDFSTRILRGDRVGLVGSNGSGKTTLLRLLLGELAPDGGTVRRGTNVEVAYYDQQREQLDPDRTVADTVGDGNDTVTVSGRSRHVMGYLQDFLFPPERARSPVRALSGGERNRLLLARLFTRPANVLVLDEPTNDLDLETLELLEAQLVDWPGTLLLVSHDRRFLDHVVTSTIAFEGEGRVREYVGGYADWVRQRQAAPEAAPETAPTSGRAQTAGRAAAPDMAPVPTPPGAAAPAGPRRLSYKEQRELDALPGLIEALETEQRVLEAEVSAPEFYRTPAAQMAERLARLDALPSLLIDAYARWEALDARAR